MDILRRAYTPLNDGPNLPVALVVGDDAREMARYTTWWAPQRERVDNSRVLQAPPPVVVAPMIALELVPMRGVVVGITPATIAMVGPLRSTPPPLLTRGGQGGPLSPMIRRDL